MHVHCIEGALQFATVESEGPNESRVRVGVFCVVFVELYLAGRKDYD